MANSELLALVVAKLSPGPGEHVAATHEASLMQGWVRTSRILALLEKEGNYALVVFLSSQTPPIAYSELTVERVLPINSDFKCDIDTESRHQDGTDVYITSRKLKLLFEMIPGNRTNNFVSEVLRAVDLLSKKRNGAQDFSWLSKYNPSSAVDENAEEAINDPFLDSPEMAVPRQSIAKGHTPIAARESVIRYQMAMKEDDYTYSQTLRVFVGTWNVNGQPASVSLQPWLACDPEPPDIYAVGFQELDLSKEAFLFNDTPREEEWRQAVLAALHPKAQYQQVALVRLVGMLLLVFVQKHHSNYVRSCAFETVGTGIMGKMGNKGGVSIRLEIHNTSMCFVNSHLAAHVEEYERRNQDFHDICSRTSFSMFLPPKGIKDHDQVYWLGDLNYRITELEPNIVKKYIEQQNYRPVLEYDQLRRQHREKAVFVGYTEGEITFRPTYKYDPGSDDWDSSEKNRAPAWCDRVLWRGEGIKQLEYRSHPVLRISDHKPVSAVFSSDVRVIDAAKYRKIHEDVMKKLDKLENEFLPQVMVDNTEVIFDTPLRFLEAQTRELIIANTGQVPVQFEFIKKLDDPNYCKEWLNIEPYTGFIMPGEKCDIRLEVYVDKRSACKMNSGQDQLYDILVLHLDGGKDIFITVTGTYERSCFGSSIEALVHMNVPVREIPAGKIIELENCKGEGLGGSPPYMVPKEIWYLVDHLYRHALKTQHLFENPGLHSELVQIRNWLDSSPNDPLPGSVHSVAEALLLLLESTAEPIIPYNLQNVCLGASSNYLPCKQIVMQLPDTSKNVFLYLCFFLQELLSHSSDNQLDGKTLATLFGAIFMREPPRSRNVGSSRSKTNQQEADRKKANFVYHFLVNDTSELVMGCS